ncbi:flavin reductase family protein [Abyssalbus ytuae]|uniref:Flavin reductase family protein n=1 Tax=Abyssalbus ytuae TaxID=2926907 RepID=A0A9E6ZLT5_9FLAO|nr:flavin reductase family protein [Abyssalbus ytuae]UOB18167.1 flavin reductase family protein [Abyssalbus ytuae]
MLTIDPQNVETHIFHQYLLGSVSPRPIAFASTVDAKGNVNLSPYSFFNCFSAKPPVLVFSPSRRVRDNTIKHTLENILETKEVVINIVNYSMAEQMSLSSTEYKKGVNEFIKAGFTEEKSVKVKPPRISQSPVAFECKVNDIIELGKEGGAGNLIICEVLLVHINENILDENNMISPFKLDAVARMGGNWYCRTNSTNIFEIPRPVSYSIGFDNLPPTLLQSRVLTGNNLARLASVEKIPEITPEDGFLDSKLDNLFNKADGNKQVFVDKVHQKMKELIENNKITDAWKLLLKHENYK